MFRYFLGLHIWFISTAIDGPYFMRNLDYICSSIWSMFAAVVPQFDTFVSMVYFLLPKDVMGKPVLLHSNACSPDT